MQKVKEKVILRILAQESLNLELWLERYEDLKCRGAFHDFFGLGTFLEIVFKIQWLDCEFLDCGLITENSWDLSIRFPRKYGITIKICKEKSVDSMHGS
jgi:hypothetical protein